LTTEEYSYATHPWTQTDFLIYRKVDKSPVLVIEVDGYAFHREGTRQAERDALKDSVLAEMWAADPAVVNGWERRAKPDQDQVGCCSRG
jgi:hypothetical protein